MFENVTIDVSGNNESGAITINWQWVVDQSKELPWCKYFFCSIDENKLLDRSLFLEDEIMSYFNDNVIEIKSRDVRQKIEEYRTLNPENCELVYCRLNDGASIQKQVTCNLKKTDLRRVFLVCVYDDVNFVARVVPVRSETQISFTVKPKGMFRNYQTITVNEQGGDSSRRLVLRSGDSRPYSYSILADDVREFYVPVETDLKSIKIMYLSTILGSDI